MTETEIRIPIKGTKLNIHGILRGELTQPIIVLAHGLSGWMHETLMFNASRYFEGKGVSSLRVSLVGDGDDQRNISDFGVHENANDIDAITDYLRENGVNKIAVVGHSYSGMAIVYSRKQKFDAAVLWDPSHTDGYETKNAKDNLEKDFKFIKELDTYVSGLGSGYVISRKVFENYQPGSHVMAQKFKIPTLIISAGLSKVMQNYGKLYASEISAETKQVIIKNSSHPFVEDGAMEKLFDATYEWLKNKLIEGR